MPRPWSQQKATSSSFGHQDGNENEPEGFYQQEWYSRRDGGSQFGWQSRCDQSRNHNQYRRHDQSRNRGYKDQDRPQPQERSQSYYEDREYDTHTRDNNTRGRSLATFRSEEYSAEQVTYDYTDVRLKDPQAATRFDYSDLLGCSGGSGYASRSTGYQYDTHIAAKVQVFNSMPPNQNPPPSSGKDRSSGMAARAFPASITPHGDITMVKEKNKDYGRTSRCDEDHRDFACSSIKDQSSHHKSGSGCSHGQGGRENWNGDHHWWDKKVEHQSCTFIPARAEDKDWDDNLDRAAATIQQAHQSYQADQADQEGATPLDDHITPRDYYSNPPKPQPGSYPGGKQLTSRNTTYAELQSSLITQVEENLVLWGRVETNMSADTPSPDGYWKLPTPPPPKEGEQGYGAYMDRMAMEEKEFHQEQQRKWEEWQQESTKFEVLECGFATNEPHPSDDVLQWLKWNNDNLRTYPKWETELQSICPIDYSKLARWMYLSWQWPKAVYKLGILNIPCPPAPDHLRVWIFKVDDLSHLKLMPNHYLCVQYTRALQFAAATTTNVVMWWPAESLTAFIMAMSPFYTITESMVKLCSHSAIP